MPTAARLFAAIGFAIVAFFATESFKFLLPEGSSTGAMSLFNLSLGAIVGWLVMGRLAGDGYKNAMAHGLRTGAVLTFYALFFQCTWEMLRISTRSRYDGPVEAIAGVFEQIYKYGSMAVTSVEVMVILVVGSVLAAWLSEWANERWN